MPIPSIPDLESTAKRLVWAAQKKGTLQNLTPRLIRQAIENELALDEGVLDASEYKSSIKAATKYALDNDPPPADVESTPKSKPPTKNKRKSDGTVKAEPEMEKDEAEIPSPQPTPKAKAKTKTKTVAKLVAREDEGSDEAPTPKKRKVAPKSKKAALSEEEDDYMDDDASPKKKPRARAVKAKAKKVVSEDEDEEDEQPDVAAAPTKPKSKKDSKVYKSLEHVPTSDMEQDEPEPLAGPSVVKPNVPAKLKSPRKSKADPKPDSASRKPPSSKKAEAAVPTPIDAETDDVAHKSESELSVLLDDLPKPKRKSSSGDKPSKKASEKPKTKKATKAPVVLSKDEETIKRLKSLVVACGTRKVWSKVFQGLDSPQQQIRKLKEMLSDLGMTGRMSLDQAKAIKEKRELAQELADVTEFAAKMEARGGSSAKSKSVEPDTAVKEEKGGSSEDEEIQAPRKRMMNARKSILAFLDDQSDDE
ncbi:hypothetical protein HYPSUDRAFT_215081 [Hypholoma sublateritium FD-334 SS-4]|uniref:DEK C-terminal domain-containing protein n=1 Tax=Hypholoma sublateritium (strain FD-334 SS-4) TaxID=945553 RepID=A0A0D2L8E1_HYPSF|nr:hypothetical protein HYPSUDRAFT_215081 [Hypholoma sublateritium FD-334 SS-4]